MQGNSGITSKICKLLRHGSSGLNNEISKFVESIMIAYVNKNVIELEYVIVIR